MAVFVGNNIMLMPMGPYFVSSICLALMVLTWLVPGPEEKIVFLDVGQGDATLLQSGVSQVLIDGGAGMTVLGELAREMPALDRKIEVLIATHPDKDHLEGLVHVVERYEVGLVLLPAISHDSQLQNAWLKRLIEKLEREEVSYRFAGVPNHVGFGAGRQRLLMGDIVVTVLGPFLNEEGEVWAPGGKTNNASVLARVDFGGLSLLLTGDAEAAVERKLISDANLRTHPNAANILNVDVLKAGHHGSKTSTTQALLGVAKPSAVVISAGKENRFGHPHADVLKRLENFRVWRTDEDGAVKFIFLDGRWLERSTNNSSVGKTAVVH